MAAVAGAGRRGRRAARTRDGRLPRRSQTPHLERAGPVRVDEHRRADSASPPPAPTSRAVSVDSVSGDGNARSSSENCVMRAGAGSSSMRHDDRCAQRRADAIRDRAAAACAATRASRIGAGNCSTARVRPCDRSAADRDGSRRRRDRRARARPTAARAAARTRTTAARARRSAIRARGGRDSAASRDRARTDAVEPARQPLQRHAAPAEPRRQVRARAAPPARRASRCPTARTSRRAARDRGRSSPAAASRSPAAA